MKNKLYNIATVDGISQRFGQPIKIQGVECFVHTNYYVDGLIIWNVSHLETGCTICEKFTKKAAIELANKLITEQYDAIEKGRQMLLEKGFELPLNQIE